MISPIARPSNDCRCRLEWMDAQEYAALPKTLRMREVKVKGRVLVTPLHEPGYASAQALDQLYGMRWSIEVDFRSLKATMAMDVLCCKSKEMVDKEIAAYMLAYNLVQRPGRMEPRAKKQRPKPLPLLNAPRTAARAAIRMRRGLS